MPSKTVVVIAGDVTSEEVLEEVKNTFSVLPQIKRRLKEKLKEKQTTPALLLKKKK